MRPEITNEACTCRGSNAVVVDQIPDGAITTRVHVDSVGDSHERYYLRIADGSEYEISEIQAAWIFALVEHARQEARTTYSCARHVHDLYHREMTNG